MNIKSRESNPRQVDKSGVPEEEKGSGALEEEGVQGSQGGEKDNLFFLNCFVLVRRFLLRRNMSSSKILCYID